jgi:predicted RND superfamily exporter protein
VVVTGSPPLRAILIEALQHDMVLTISIAALLIFLLIAVVKRSAGNSAIVMAPLMIGLVWTLGIVGWLGMSLSIATAGLGAMILGLGTEFGIFLLERYKEERDKGFDKEKSLKIALPSVGYGIIGSGLTTIIGFGVLVISPMPMLQNLGKMLALGIFCILVATIFAAPSIMLAEEDLSESLVRRIRGGGKK